MFEVYLSEVRPLPLSPITYSFSSPSLRLKLSDCVGHDNVFRTVGGDCLRMRSSDRIQCGTQVLAGADHLEYRAVVVPTQVLLSSSAKGFSSAFRLTPWPLSVFLCRYRRHWVSRPPITLYHLPPLKWHLTEKSLSIVSLGSFYYFFKPQVPVQIPFRVEFQIPIFLLRVEIISHAESGTNNTAPCTGVKFKI